MLATTKDPVMISSNIDFFDPPPAAREEEPYRTNEEIDALLAEYDSR